MAGHSALSGGMLVRHEAQARLALRCAVCLPLVLSVLVMAPNPCPAQLLREMEYQVLPSDHIVLTDPKASLLVVESSIPRLTFDSNSGVDSVELVHQGVYHIRLRPGPQLVTILADGFVGLENLPFTFVPQGALRLRVMPKLVESYAGAYDESRPVIRLKYMPVSPTEVIYGGLDGNVMVLDFQQGYRIFRPTPGRHSLRLNSGGRLWEHTYELQPGQQVETQVSFSEGAPEQWTIQPPGILNITSQPEGASVWVDGMEQGHTPLTLNVQPGQHKIEVIKDLYLPELRHGEVQSLEYVTVHVDLVPNWGRLRMDSDPPHAMLWLNNRQWGVLPYEQGQVNAGKYAVRLALPFYHELRDTVTVPVGGEFIRTYRLRPQFGVVTVTSVPRGATVVVDGDSWGSTPIRRDTVVSGSHKIRVSYSNEYYEEEDLVQVQDQDTLSLNYTLRLKGARLSVFTTPSGAEVRMLDDERSLGMTPLDHSLVPAGIHTIRIMKEFYQPLDTVLVASIGDTLTVLAHLSIGKGNLYVNSVPVGVTVFLNDSAHGVTPIAIKDIPAGRYGMRLVKPGYDVLRRQITVQTNSFSSLMDTLGTEQIDRWRRNRSRARALSLVVPTYGQFTQHEYVRGALYIAAIAGSAGWLANTIVYYNDKRTLYDREITAYGVSIAQADMDYHYDTASRARQSMREARDQSVLAASGIVAVYVIQALDAWLVSGRPRDLDSGPAMNHTPDLRLRSFARPDEACLGIGLTLNLP